MTTQFPIEWENFTPHEVRKLKKLWSSYSFPSQFSTDFHGVVSNGTPGVIFIEAVDKGLYANHWRIPINFGSLEDLVREAAAIVTQSSERFPEPPDGLAARLGS
jgi:hypothetical protein